MKSIPKFKLERYIKNNWPEDSFYDGVAAAESFYKEMAVEFSKEISIEFALWCMKTLIRKYDGFIFTYSKIDAKEQPIEYYFNHFLTIRNQSK